MSPRLRLVVLALVVGALFATAALTLPHDPAGLEQLVGTGGLVTAVVLLAAWVVLTPALFPGTVLAAACGLALGIPAGFAVSLAGATLGGLAAFALARRTAGESVGELKRPKLRKLQERLERRGFVTILCARLAPGVPSTALHYVAGLSRVRPSAFAGGICLGGAPRIAMYVAVGGALSQPLSPVFLGAVGAIVLMAVVPALVVVWRRRRAAAVPA